MRALIILAIAAFATAAPSGLSNSTTLTGREVHPYLDQGHKTLRAREVPGVYVCSGPEWSGSCVWQRSVTGVCMALPEGEKVSFGPDKGIQCRLFTGDKCDGAASGGRLAFPGSPSANEVDRLPRQTFENMPTTRGTTKKQTKLEDFHEEPQETTKQASTKTLSEKKGVNGRIVKRKTTSNGTKTSASPPPPPPPPKKQKTQNPRKQQQQQQQQQQETGHDDSADPDDNITTATTIIINRAPVLQLWAAVVSQFLHPDLSWPACLSIGNAISTLCAISKGRAIGMIDPKQEDDDDDDDDDNDDDDGDEASETEREAETKRKEKPKRETKEVPTMGFPLHLKGDAVMMGGKPKSYSEGALRSKFGGEECYEAAKAVMVEALETWGGDKDGLDKKAFHMYEKFRPDVAKGQRGWGRKGELDLDKVAETVRRAT